MGQSPPKFSPAAASASGDVLLSAKSKDGPATAVMSNGATFRLAFDQTRAQNDLSALFVSNVVGRAQMALNLNIAAAELNLIPGSQDPFANPIGNTPIQGEGNVTAVVRQVNTGIQFRGTPLTGTTNTNGGFFTNVTHNNQ